METPLLSVVTITYNHEPYIEKTIQGVLMQKVNFPIEFIIAEDCSTDNTRAICQKYAKDYPNLIKLIISDKNVGILANEKRAMSVVKGKYIAFCEGDDYWTDPYKLQKQVDFLEKNIAFSVCFHNRMVEREGKVLYEPDIESFHRYNSETGGFEVSLEDSLYNWITFPFSMVFRSSLFHLQWYDEFKYFRDTHLISFLLCEGKGFVFNWIGGVHTFHLGSMVSSYLINGFNDITIKVARELYAYRPNPVFKKYYMDQLQWYLYDYKKHKKYKLKYSLILLSLSRNFKKFIKNLIR